ncbi:MAG: chemotaxis protein CheW [Nitrospirae bacterium]|nr:chemotaxis protein CheW [Nitrospirota bacterium]
MSQRQDKQAAKTSKRIDWQEVHKLIEKNQRAINSGWQPSPEERLRILKERTAVLAREPIIEEERAGLIEAVEFMLAHQRYGIDSQYVKEVIPLRDYTPVPCTPPLVVGVINLRGQIISVVDIKNLFELPDAEETELSSVIILHNNTMEFAITVDEIIGIRKVRLKELQCDLTTLTGRQGEYFKGIAREHSTDLGGDGSNIILLDAIKLLTDSRLIVNEEVIE